jgi:hypothetical protein
VLERPEIDGNHVNNNGYSALMAAVDNRFNDISGVKAAEVRGIIRALMGHYSFCRKPGAEGGPKYTGRTALILAILKNHCYIMETLLECKDLDINALDIKYG